MNGYRTVLSLSQGPVSRVPRNPISSAAFSVSHPRAAKRLPSRITAVWAGVQARDPAAMLGKRLYPSVFIAVYIEEAFDGLTVATSKNAYFAERTGNHGVSEHDTRIYRPFAV